MHTPQIWETTVFRHTIRSSPPLTGIGGRINLMTFRLIPGVFPPHPMQSVLSAQITFLDFLFHLPLKGNSILQKMSL